MICRYEQYYVKPSKCQGQDKLENSYNRWTTIIWLLSSCYLLHSQNQPFQLLLSLQSVLLEGQSTILALLQAVQFGFLIEIVQCFIQCLCQHSYTENPQVYICPVWFVLLFILSSLPVHFVTLEAPGDCSHLRPVELALLQPQVKEAWKVPQERDVGVVGGSMLRPS